jgi:membrane fusion protein, heavy metal efflux system
VGRQQQTVEYRRRMSERMQRLFALKSASQQEVERARTDLESAETDLRNARISVQKETVHLADLLRMPESEVTHVDETTEQAPILAPIDGQVVDRKITLGSVVEPGQELFTVSDLSSVWMTASVNEADISKVRVGSRISARTAAYPDQAFQGRVTYIAAGLDPQTRTLPVRILLPNTERKLHPGMFADAELVEGSSRKSVFIPEEAIQDLNGGSVVFARKGDTSFEPQPIEISNRLNGRAEIRAGLNEGDTIVTRGSFIVKSELLKSKVGE